MITEHAFPGAYVAFPVNGPSKGVMVHEGGMTLREYYAGQALPGIIASLASLSPKLDSKGVARLTVAIAEALIEELDK